MRVSVIIPVYNAAGFLNKAVDSALEQKEVCEVLLIEDGSEDESLAVCKKLALKHDKVQLFQHPGGLNRGAGATRNLGLKKASFEYIAFLDADDYYLPERFARDAAVFRQKPDAEGVYNATGIHFYTKNEKIRSQFQRRSFTSLKKSVPPENLFYEMTPLGTAGHFHLNALTIKRKILQKTGGFNSQLKLSQDTHFCIKLAAVCRLYPGQILSPVTIRGVHDDNRSADAKKFLDYHLIMYKDLIEWGKQMKLSNDKMGILWWNHYGLTNQKNKPDSTFIKNLKKIRFILESLLHYPRLIFSSKFQEALFR